MKNVFANKIGMGKDYRWTRAWRDIGKLEIHHSPLGHWGYFQSKLHVAQHPLPG